MHLLAQHASKSTCFRWSTFRFFTLIIINHRKKTFSQQNSFWLRSTVLSMELHTGNRTPVKLQDTETYKHSNAHVIMLQRRCKNLPLPQNSPQKTTKFKFCEANHIEHYIHSRLYQICWHQNCLLNIKKYQNHLFQKSSPQLHFFPCLLHKCP